MNVAAIVEALDAYTAGPLARSGRWTADCPCCGGGGTVRIVDRANQRLLVWCFAGCRREAILSSLGIDSAGTAR